MGRPMITRRCALLDAKEMRAGRASRPVVGRIASGGGRRRPMLMRGDGRTLLLGCAAVHALVAARCRTMAHDVARLRRACRGRVRGPAPRTIFVMAAAGGGRLSAVLRRCRDG
ncbi:hypothetical protein F511_47025 [Dorcoceras hygrometricum]|uniref:Uncharacterized protein n=1 Tax=Dorcoceras hygrometricum TaxID=472368 RepID=A0A2Z6ZT47_9LAMI|nr:hypothetical protein F511_47025 [Dorcoceras hygrometricum]